MSDAIRDAAAINKGGRRKLARGAATTSPEIGPAWSVRGVPSNVRAIARREAAYHNATVGDWLVEAIVHKARARRAAPVLAWAPPPGPPAVIPTAAAPAARPERRFEWRQLLASCRSWLRRALGALAAPV